MHILLFRKGTDIRLPKIIVVVLNIQYALQNKSLNF